MAFWKRKRKAFRRLKRCLTPKVAPMRLALLFLIVTMLTPIATIAQNFGSVGTEWHYSRSKSASGQPNSAYRFIESTKDTVIRGQQVHKLMYTDVTNGGDTSSGVLAYVYQDADTIKMYSKARQAFFNYWIENQQVRDTLKLGAPFVDSGSPREPTYRLTITNIDTIVQNGAQLPQYETRTVSSGPSFRMGSFIEPIGKRVGFFPDTDLSIPEQKAESVRCFSNDSLNLQLTDSSCRYLAEPITSINDIVSPESITVYPNPVEYQLTMEVPQGRKVAKATLTTLKGQTVRQTTNKTMNTAAIEPGVYVLVVTYPDDSQSHQKVVKE